MYTVFCTNRKTHRFHDVFFLVAGTGFEPVTFGLWARRATWLLYPATLQLRRILPNLAMTVNRGPS